MIKYTFALLQNTIKELKYLPPQSLACEVYRKQENEIKDLLRQSRRTRKINVKMQQRVVKSLFLQSFLRQIIHKMHLKPNITSSSAVSHVRSLRSNVRKASKISILYIHYTAIFDLNSAKKKSVLNKPKFLKNKILKSIAILWTFCKGYGKAKWLKNGRFWERSSDQPTR